MPISDIPILSMLRTRMQWHQARQLVLAENVANADTPNYRARDLAPPNFDSALQTASLTLARTDPGHVGMSSGGIRRSPRITTGITRSVLAVRRSATKKRCSNLPAIRWTTTR